MIVTILMIWRDVEQFKSGLTIVREKKKPKKTKTPRMIKECDIFLP